MSRLCTNEWTNEREGESGSERRFTEIYRCAFLNAIFTMWYFSSNYNTPKIFSGSIELKLNCPIYANIDAKFGSSRIFLIFVVVVFFVVEWIPLREDVVIHSTREMQKCRHFWACIGVVIRFFMYVYLRCRAHTNKQKQIRCVFLFIWYKQSKSSK